MSGDTPAATPPETRLFSAGIRFVSPKDSFLVHIFPIMVQCASETEAMGTAWALFKANTYDEQKDLYHLLGEIIFPFHVGVVDCTEFLNTLAEIANEKTKKPKRKPQQTSDNVVDLFPGGPPKKPPKKPSSTPPKK